MNIGIHANLNKPAAAATLKELARAAKDLNLALAACDRAAVRLAPGCRYVPPARFGKHIDALLSLGGDGTVLQAVRILNGAKAPVLGINLGNLGFLTSVPDTHAVQALQAIAAGAYQLTEYPLLEAKLHRAGAPQKDAAVKALALNDIVIGWGLSPRAVNIEVAVNRRRIASYVCDGLIVATPVGSTGHALSAGGPILHRGLPAVVLEPICPHTLSNRPLVIPNTSAISLQIGGGGKKLLLSVDGQDSGWLEPGDRLDIRKARQTARFIQLPGDSWYALLSRKLHWRGSSSDPK